MKKRISTLTMIVIATASLSTLANDLAADADIKAVVASMQNGWNHKDGAEFAKRFSVDADYVIVNGTRVKGRDQIAADHQQIFDTIYKTSQLELKIENARLIRPDVAIVHVGTHLVVGNGDTSLEKYGRVTLVLIKRSGRWEITDFQNTPIPAEGSKR